MTATMKVGQTVVVHSGPEDAAGNGPAVVAPGTGGNTGTQWLPQTAGIVSKVAQGVEGIDCQFTGVTPGSTVVNVMGTSAGGVQKITPFTLNVTVGDLDHFDPVAEAPVG